MKKNTDDKISIWEKWLDLKDKCRRKKISSEIINEFEEILLMERTRVLRLIPRGYKRKSNGNKNKN